MKTSQWFALAGGLLQIGGFAAVVMASTAELAREYKDYGFLMRQVLRMRDFWLYWFGTLPPPVQLSGSAQGSIGLRGTATERKIPESEVERLQRELNELKTEVEQLKEDTEGRFAAVEQRVQALREHLTARTDTLQKRLDAIRRGTLKKERRGGWAFMLGTALLLVAAFV